MTAALGCLRRVRPEASQSRGPRDLEVTMSTPNIQTPVKGTAPAPTSKPETAAPIPPKVAPLPGSKPTVAEVAPPKDPIKSTSAPAPGKAAPSDTPAAKSSGTVEKH